MASFEIKRRNGDTYIVLVDDDDLHLVMSMGKWGVLVQPGKTVYVRKTLNSQKRLLSLHRFLMNPPEGVQVDHINGNGLDNRRANLRLASCSENNRNRGTSRNNTSGIKGVRWNKARQKWQACLDAKDLPRYWGLFDTKEEAAEVIQSVRARLFGEFERY